MHPREADDHEVRVVSATEARKKTRHDVAPGLRGPAAVVPPAPKDPSDPTYLGRDPNVEGR